MSSEEEVVLTINKEYARKYEERKKAEELSKRVLHYQLSPEWLSLVVINDVVFIVVRERYGDVPLDEEDSSSSSEEEDDEGMVS